MKEWVDYAQDHEEAVVVGRFDGARDPVEILTEVRAKLPMRLGTVLRLIRDGDAEPGRIVQPPTRW